MPHDCYTTIRFVRYAVYVYFDQPTTVIIVIVKRKEKTKDRKETMGEFGVNVEKKVKEATVIAYQRRKR